MMRIGLGLLCVLFYWGCSLSGNDGLPTPPDRQVNQDDPHLYQLQGLWRYNGKVFSGYIIQEQPNNHILISKTPIIEGLTTGKVLGFFENGHKLLEQSLVRDRQEGAYIQWWRNGQCRYQFFYKDDQYDGKQKAFFENGRLREEANYSAGKLDGLQRVWDEKGQLISNYTIRNNKVYGIISVESCIPGAKH